MEPLYPSVIIYTLFVLFILKILKLNVTLLQYLSNLDTNLSHVKKNHVCPLCVFILINKAVHICHIYNIWRAQNLY